MKDSTWRHTGRKFGGAHSVGMGSRGGESSRTAIMRALGSVVYVARLDDGRIKIGWTERFDLRLHWLKHYVQQDVELLAFRVGTYEDEQAIHERLAAHRSVRPGHDREREYYDASPEVLALVNEMRDALNLPHVAA